MLLPLSMLLAVAPLDVPGCTASKSAVGSIHANTSFEVQMTVAASKLKQPLECGKKQVTLFISEYASTAQVDEATNFTGPQLWGGMAPTRDHSDELLTNGKIVVVASGPGVAAATAALTEKGFKQWRGGTSADVTERIGKEIDCKPASKDPLRAWCAAAATSGAGFAVPKDKTVLLGISAPLSQAHDLKKALLAATRVSALSTQGGKVLLTDITPENDDEKRQLAEVAAQVAMVLKDPKVKSVAVSKDLAGFLPSLPARAATEGTAVTAQAKGPGRFKFKFPARAWTVKQGGLEVYVVAEDAPDGSWLSVYPVVPFTAK